MKFACIHDCSVCPFYGHDVSTRVYQQLEKTMLPAGLRSTEIVSEPDTKKESAIEPEENNENLPAVQEIQYTIEDYEPKKKSLFNWRKK